MRERERAKERERERERERGKERDRKGGVREMVSPSSSASDKTQCF